MKTVLVISADEPTRKAWCLAVRRRGMMGRAVDSILGALDELREPVAGLLVDAADDADLAALAALSATIALPPVVVVPAMVASAPVTTRMVAATMVAPGTGTVEIMARLDCLMRGRPLTSPTNLPVRLTSVSDAQWTTRLSAEPLFSHDDFDGATSPDGFDLAAHA